MQAGGILDVCNKCARRCSQRSHSLKPRAKSRSATVWIWEELIVQPIWHMAK